VRTVEAMRTWSPDAEVRWRSARPVDLVATLAPLRRGGFDPAHRVATGRTGARVVWRTTRTPDGPATYRLLQRGRSEVDCSAWGPGAAHVVRTLPDLLGEGDRAADEFVPRHALLEQAHRRNPGLRVPRSGQVLEALVPAVLEQRVHARQAWASWAWLLRRHGEPAPGPAPSGMRVPPTAEAWRAVPQWDWHRAGVDPGRMRTAVACARVAPQLERCAELSLPAAYARLRSVPGVGPWTAAEVGLRALGDTDALSVGDFHLASFVGWALVGRPLDDDGMVELLEQWRPHRQRVVRLLELTPAARKPRFGPRLSYQDHRAH
jgi:3-methyladenine DNA glycosylase/8-oxoguanine DNA glycosylase